MRVNLRDAVHPYAAAGKILLGAAQAAQTRVEARAQSDRSALEAERASDLTPVIGSPVRGERRSARC